MKNATAGIRQGDVLLVPCTVRKTNKMVDVKPVNGRYILAYGEATGHHHSLALSPKIAMFRDDGIGNGNTYISVKEAMPLEHQEHSALLVQPGSYQVVIQRTYHSGISVRVQD